MNVWLCPIKPKSWRIIKTFKVFGFPKHTSKVVSKVRPNDLIIFHALKPVNARAQGGCSQFQSLVLVDITIYVEEYQMKIVKVIVWEQESRSFMSDDPDLF